MSAARKLKPPTSDAADAPAWNVAQQLPTAIIGKPWSAKLPKAKSAPADTLLYRLTGGPAWLTFNPATRTLSGTPTNIGCQRVRLTAYNGTAAAERQTAFVVESPVERFGHLDEDTDKWIGQPQETVTDTLALDKDKPEDKSRVTRIQNGALALFNEGRITTGMLTAATRFADDWSTGGTSRPLRASEARFLGVSMSCAGSSDGFPVYQIDAASRYREACAAIGTRATERLNTFVCLGASFRAAEKLLGVDRKALAAQLVADLERLTEHYSEIANQKEPAPWNRGRRGGR
jgi:hypothetical protein